MKFLKKNGAVIIFYMVILVSTLILIDDVKKDNLREESRYVMVNLSK